METPRDWNGVFYSCEDKEDKLLADCQLVALINL